MYVNVAFAAPGLIGALLLAMPVITKKPNSTFGASSW